MTSAAEEVLLEGSDATPVKEDRSASERLAARYVLFGLAAVALCGFLPGFLPRPLGILVTLGLAWYTLSMATLAWAFLSRDAGILGKQQDGTMAWPSVFVLLPYLVAIRLFARLKRQFVASARSVDEVAPGIFLGPLPMASDVPRSVTMVVDLTAEFYESRGVIEGRRYLCLPTLNRVVPKDEELTKLLGELAESREAMLIHCGAGKGRSAEVAAALLLLRGLAGSVEEAEERLRQARPCVRLHTVQRQQVNRLFVPSPKSVTP